MELAPGAFVTPQIRLRRPLRRGGMGSVWVADHLALRCEVVVKLMSEELAADSRSLARFSREAAASAQLRSPHVVQVLDHGVTAEGRPFIVMELLEGRDLGQLLRERTLSPLETAHVVEHVARALARAHERGVLHRDIKPANIFLCDVGGPEPFVKLIDFGVAKGLHETSDVTSTGDMIGTPQYMSPEQVHGSRDIDCRADIWAVGVVAYRCITGVVPFQGESLVTVALQIVQSETPRLTAVRPELPPALDRWFAQACARERDKRFGSARAMADALWTAIGAQPPAVTGSSLPRAEAPPIAGVRVSAGLPEENTTMGGVNSAIPAARRRAGGRVALGIGIGMTAALLVGVTALAIRGRAPEASGAAATTSPEPTSPQSAATAPPAAPTPAEPATPAPTASASVAPSATQSAAAAPLRPKVPVAPSKRPVPRNDEPDDGF